MSKTFTKPELDAKIVENLESIIEKFRGKNESYGDQADGLYNFRETAIEFRELFGDDLLEAQFQVAMVLFHKHFVTLKKNGLKDPEFKDRMGDWIAYGAIMMAMGDLVSMKDEVEYMSYEEALRYCEANPRDRVAYRGLEHHGYLQWCNVYDSVRLFDNRPSFAVDHLPSEFYVL